MRHRKHTFKLGRTSSHRRCMVANMLKDLIYRERIVTSVPKAKELRRHADRMITLAKKKTLASKREAMGRLMVRFNKLNSKEQRAAKEGDTSSYNTDRKVMGKLDELADRFASRPGGYTRIIHKGKRVGDNADLCVIEYLSE
ncbi:MAG: 50S ribosomal protein L17 [Chlamydiales bacterium]|nr:50S ribosomal protein L17 [Chlamydiales bacterium]MCH9636044.1 50S ribosomal protein L17 [Chlamydiales bacterium]MCH9704184.1 50S ribosomal protein L17 [Chlamydiota bacterium]